MANVLVTRAISIPCPKCGAAPDVRCASPDGARVEMHAARTTAASGATRRANANARRERESQAHPGRELAVTLSKIVDEDPNT